MSQDQPFSERRADNAEILATVRETKSMVEDIHVTLHGPKGEPYKGHVIRLDRLEQKQKWIWSALIASIAALAKAVWTTITGR